MKIDLRHAFNRFFNSHDFPLKYCLLSKKTTGQHKPTIVVYRFSPSSIASRSLPSPME